MCLTLDEFVNLQKAGLQVGDLITEVGNDDVKWSSRDDVIRMIQQAGHRLHLKVVTLQTFSDPESRPTERQTRLQQHMNLVSERSIKPRMTSKSLDRTFNRRVDARGSDKRSKSKTRAHKK